MLRVGLTGGIASGKTHVLEGLRRAGLATLDLDEVAHALMEPGGEGVGPILAEFGAGVRRSDGGIDRRSLGARVFSDREARRRLNELIHPLVRLEEGRHVAEWERDGCAVGVVDGALIVEGGGHLRFDRIVVVHCPEEEQVARLRRRDGLDEGAARDRVRAQMPLVEKRRFGQFQVETSGSLQETERKTNDLAEALRRTPVGWSGAPPRERVLGALVQLPPAGPRGLDLRGLLEGAVSAGAVDLGAVARGLVPAAGGAWYEAAEGCGAACAPELLGIVGGLCELARPGPDAVHATSAAASLARLVTRSSEGIVGAALVGEATFAAAKEGRVAADWRARLREWRLVAERWGAPGCGEGVERALDMVAERGRGIAWAAEAGREGGGQDVVGRVLVGLVSGIERGQAFSTREERLAGLLAGS